MKKIFIGALVIVMTFVFTPTTTKAATLAELQAQIAQLTTQLNALNAQYALLTNSQTALVTFDKNLSFGDSGFRVKNLQNFLISKGFLDSDSATGFYGKMTVKAVMAYQKARSITPPNGYFGPKTRAVANAEVNASATSGLVYSLSASIVGAGTITGRNATYVSGTVATLTAVPRGNATFVSWTGCTSVTGTVCKVSMTGNKSVTATFTGTTEEVSYHALTTSVTGAGTILGANVNYAEGAIVTLVASSTPGATFLNWGGACAGTTGTICGLIMGESSLSVVANFSTVTNPITPETRYTLSTSTSGTGSGTISGASTSYTSGTVANLIAVPASGSTFTGWSGACTNTVGNCVIAMSGSRSVTANFTLMGNTNTTNTDTSTKYKFSLSRIGEGDGIISANTGTYVSRNISETLKSGFVVMLRAIPDAGSTFTGWGGDAASCGTNLDCNVTMTSNKSVIANFVSATSAGTQIVGMDSYCTPGIASTCTNASAIGQSVTLKWHTQNIPAGAAGHIDVSYVDGHGVNYKIADVTNTGSYVWKTGDIASSNTNKLPSGKYYVVVNFGLRANNLQEYFIWTITK